MPSVKSTTSLLMQVRALMQKQSPELLAYIVPSGDAHGNEYLADCDKRRTYISGFSGSSGSAIITPKDALLWTDGRYYLQAKEEIDSNWILMKDGLPTTPTQGDWLCKNLPIGSSIGVDPTQLPYSVWKPLKQKLSSCKMNLVPIKSNLIDMIWPEKPQAPTNPVYPLDKRYSGRTVQNKLRAIHKKMFENNVSLMILTSLDEIAWLLNLRGSDIEYNPIFFSYVIITENSFLLFIKECQYNEAIQKHLEQETDIPFKIETYSSFVPCIRPLIERTEGKVWVSEQSNTAISMIIPKEKHIMKANPVQMMKTIKNEIEIYGMRMAHIRDGVALTNFFAWLEKTLNTGCVSEIQAADKLTQFRFEQENFMGPSFETISASGENAAIIHYKPKEGSKTPISTNSIYLCDSGGQYLNGTTDVTRCLHFGKPNDYLKECFTRVLKGQINVSTAIFPKGTPGGALDTLARRYLWEIGLDYAHGTGHGIGCFLNVHEGPIGISRKTFKEEAILKPGMFLSNEPGYYEECNFGIRIEDVVLVVEACTPLSLPGDEFLKFETFTLCPIQKKLIKVELLSDSEIQHINCYHKRVRDTLAPLLKEEERDEAVHWLLKETEPIIRC